MTTAHRPTWKAAVGRAQEGGYNAISTQRSVLDEASHTKLKLRRGHQLTGTFSSAAKKNNQAAAIEASLKKLQSAERKLAELRRADVAAAKQRRAIVPEVEEEGQRRLLTQTADVDEVKLKQKYDDADDDVDENDNDKSAGGGGEDGGGGWSDLDKSDQEDESDLDHNSEASSDSDSDTSSSDDDDSDDEDEEAALQAELAKIRAEREAQKARAEAQEAKRQESKMEEAALTGNPLLNSVSGGAGGARLKRKWNDDVVFRNQAAGEERNAPKRFINDTVRNDFHKRFLNKFIR